MTIGRCVWGYLKKPTIPEDSYNQIINSHVRMLPYEYLAAPISLGILYFQMILVISKQNLYTFMH